MKYLLCLLTLLLLIGFVSADTLIFSPTIDGYAFRTSANSEYSSLTSGAGTNANIIADYDYGYLQTLATTDTGKFDTNVRKVYSFNTSTLPDTSTITSSTLYLSTYQVRITLGAFSDTVVNGSLATNTTIVTADYQKRGNLRLSANISNSSITGDNVSYSLNSDGLSWISKTSFTVLFVVQTQDLDGIFAGTWAKTKISGADMYSSRYATTGKRPWLSVNYTTGSAPVASFTTAKTLYRIPGTLQVNDTSTNTPTLWNWSWGDGTWTNGTTQNATHTYTKRGRWPVSLLCSNANGDNTTPTTQPIRIVGYENLW